MAAELPSLPPANNHRDVIKSHLSKNASHYFSLISKMFLLVLDTLHCVLFLCIGIANRQQLTMTMFYTSS